MSTVADHEDRLGLWGRRRGRDASLLTGLLLALEISARLRPGS